MKTRRFGFAGAIAVALLFGPGSPWAQEPAPSGRSERNGFFLGLGFGPGWISADGVDVSERGVSNMLRLGKALNQQVLVGVSINGWIKSQLHGFGFGTVTGTVTYYPSASGGLFVNGGLGLGAEYNGEGGGIGPALLLGLGYDIPVLRNISVTPFANMFGSLIDDSYFGGGFEAYHVEQIGVGLTFH